MPRVEDLIPEEIRDKLNKQQTGENNTGEKNPNKRPGKHEKANLTENAALDTSAASELIKNMNEKIDHKSVEVHEDKVKNEGWIECPPLGSILPKEAGKDEYYGFCNYGNGEFLHYEFSDVHYYVVALYKKEYIKKTREKIANQEIGVPIEYYVVGSNGECFGPCGEDFTVGNRDSKPSKASLKKYVEKKQFDNLLLMTTRANHFYSHNKEKEAIGIYDNLFNLFDKYPELKEEYKLVYLEFLRGYSFVIEKENNNPLKEIDSKIITQYEEAIKYSFYSNIEDVFGSLWCDEYRVAFSSALSILKNPSSNHTEV